MATKLDAPLPPSPSQGRKAVGHPVDVASGAFFCAWHDIEIEGYAPLIFRRYFNTGLTNEREAGFGPGWTHNFASSLSETADGFRMRDHNGGVINFFKDANAPLASILNHTAGMELRREGDGLVVYHWHGWRTTVEKLWFQRLPSGQFRLVRISPPSGFGLALHYDSQGRLSIVAQMIEGRRISLRYNERGLASELLLASPSSGERSFATYRYDQLDRLIEVRDASGAPLRYAYDRAGRIITEETRSGAVFQMRYDLNGRCVNTRGSDGYHECRLQYSLEGRLTLVTNSLGDVTAYELNASGQVLAERHANGAVRSTRYDEFGRIEEQVDPVGRVTRYGYDGNSNTVSVVYPSGVTIESAYDDNPSADSSSARQVHVALYLREWPPHHGDRSQGCGETLRLRRTRGFPNLIFEPSGNTVRIVPSEDWSRLRISDDYGLDREEQYNDLMLLTRLTEPDGNSYRFDYDVLGRVVRVTYPGSPPKEYAYDATGCLAAQTDEDGHILHLRHNRSGC